MKPLAVSILAAALLAGCGGGSDQVPRAGLWKGTTATDREVSAVLLTDRSYYLLYSQPGTPGSAGGVVLGRDAAEEVSAVGGEALDYNLEGRGLSPAAVSATIDGTLRLDGSLARTGDASVQFTTAYAESFGRAAVAGELAGTYAGTASFSLGRRPAVLQVAQDGAFSTDINGCAITGTATPRGDVGVFDVQLRFGGAPCVFPNQDFAGVAWIDPGARVLNALARNTAGTQAFVFIGARN